VSDTTILLKEIQLVKNPADRFLWGDSFVVPPRYDNPKIIFNNSNQ